MPLWLNVVLVVAAVVVGLGIVLFLINKLNRV